MEGFPRLVAVHPAGEHRPLTDPGSGVGRCRCHDHIVLAALNFGAVLFGVVAGGLSASLTGLLIGGGLTLLGVDAGGDIGLSIGILTGLATAGWLAGRKAVHSHRFHGAVAGLVLAFIVMVIARFGGSTAGTTAIVWLALLSILVSGLCGWLAGRRQE